MKKADKIYKLVGQAVVYTAGWALGVAGFMYAFMQNTIY